MRSLSFFTPWCVPWELQFSDPSSMYDCVWSSLVVWRVSWLVRLLVGNCVGWLVCYTQCTLQYSVRLSSLYHFRQGQLFDELVVGSKEARCMSTYIYISHLCLTLLLHARAMAMMMVSASIWWAQTSDNNSNSPWFTNAAQTIWIMRASKINVKSATATPTHAIPLQYDSTLSYSTCRNPASAPAHSFRKCLGFCCCCRKSNCMLLAILAATVQNF